MTQRIVFVVESAFTERDHVRLNLASLEAAGAAIEIWDGSAAFGNPPDAEQRCLISPLRSSVGVRRFDAMEGIVRALNDRADLNTLFVCLVGLRNATLGLFRALGGSRTRYALLLGDVQPFGDTSLRAQRRHSVVGAIGGIFRGELASSTALLRLFGVRPPELIIAGGEASLETSETRLAGPATKVLWAHSLDYDRFLALGARQRAKAGAVFLDQYLERHPDQIRAGEPFCDPATYYANLSRAFDSVEDSLGQALVVAAHPSASYDEHDERFGGRRVIFGRTMELVAQSKWVVAHDSTAVGYAVLEGTPVTLITDDGIRRSRIRRSAADRIACLLRRRVYNLDREPPPAWEAESRIDVVAYHEFRTAFLKRDGTPDRPLWAIVMSYLRGEISAAQFKPLRVSPARKPPPGAR